MHEHFTWHNILFESPQNFTVQWMLSGSIKFITELLLSIPDTTSICQALQTIPSDELTPATCPNTKSFVKISRVPLCNSTGSPISPVTQCSMICKPSVTLMLRRGANSRVMVTILESPSTTGAVQLEPDDTDNGAGAHSLLGKYLILFGACLSGLTSRPPHSAPTAFDGGIPPLSADPLTPYVNAVVRSTTLASTNFTAKTAKLVMTVQMSTAVIATAPLTTMHQQTGPA
ncbi:hypothetical protein AX15_007334, partial [Amanita polypyramis BW_CC]